MIGSRTDIKAVAKAVLERIDHPFHDGARVQGAVNDFITSMWDSTGVDAIAVLIAEEPDCPTTLALRVLMPLNPESESASQTLRLVTEAESDLSAQLMPELPSGMRIVSTAKYSAQELQPRLSDRWKKSKTLCERAFIRFERL